MSELLGDLVGDFVPLGTLFINPYGRAGLGHAVSPYTVGCF